MQKKVPPYAIEVWSKNHDASSFTSDRTSIKRYIQEQAHRDTSSRTAAVFVLVETGQKIVRGYYSLSSISITFSELPEKFQKTLPRYPEASAILLGRLGVDKDFSAQQTQESGAKPKFGQTLLVNAQERCLKNTSEVGSALMVIDAEMPSAHELALGALDPLPFLTQYGFSPLSANPRRLVKTMRAIAKEFEVP